ncbi:hypothetical protein FGO68_gene2641 [Halteria grandinella]|uniref:Uncharacterized protein n=1 Tax=Halteria grandinella TaxID=5974 RepID=A0A8J8NQH7_HALGN|nr:hypothetical protein FGO68_gene2641 [Halteria grandinella]
MRSQTLFNVSTRKFALLTPFFAKPFYGVQNLQLCLLQNVLILCIRTSFSCEQKSHGGSCSIKSSMNRHTGDM